MAHQHLSWKLVDDTGAQLLASEANRLKWRQRGVPLKWRVAILSVLTEQGLTFGLSDFDSLPLTPGRIAA